MPLSKPRPALSVRPQAKTADDASPRLSTVPSTLRAPIHATAPKLPKLASATGSLQTNREDLNTNILRHALQDGIKIQVGYAFSRIVFPTEAIVLASLKFRAKVHNAQFIPSVKAGHWDGFRSMVNKRDGSFGTGLLPDMVKYFKYQIGVQNLEIEDLRTEPEKMYDYEWIFPVPFRAVQLEALKNMRANTHGILKLPTAVGKTVCMSKMIQEKGVRTLVCVPTKELLYQETEVLQKQVAGDDLKVGLLGDNNWPDEDCSVVVAMYPSLVSLRGDTKPQRIQFMETMSAFDLLLCDECHKICSRDQITKTWETIMDINAYWRFGISATPFEYEDTIAEFLMRSAFGHIVYNYSMQEAKAAGYVTPFTVVFLRPTYSDERTKIGTTGMNFNEAHDYFISTNEARNQAVVEAVQLLLKDNRKTMVIAHRINHNELLAKLLAEVLGEENVYMLHGELDPTYRKEAMAEFKARKDPCVIVASAVGNDGIDIPDIAGLVLAQGGKSFFQNVQRAGRGLRTAEGKKDLLFIDFDDSSLGRWFKNHTQSRYRYYTGLGAQIILPDGSNLKLRAGTTAPQDTDAASRIN